MVQTLAKKSEQTEAAPAQPVPFSHFIREDGTVDLEGLLRVAGEEEPASPVATAYHQHLARFVARRIEEVQVAEAFHVLPDGIPWNRQPWWKTTIWLQYKAGYSKGLDRRRAH